jgi:anti-anti-sigma factor
MGQVSLSMSVQIIGGSVAVMALDGIVMAEAEGVMAEALEHAAGKGAQSVVLDFSRVSGIDSGGASTLVKLWALAKSRRIDLSAAGLDAGIKEILDLTQLARVMPSFADLSQALSAAGAGTGIPSPAEAKRFDVAEGSSPGVNRGSVVYWAKPVEKLHVTKIEGSISSLNVEGRHPVGPIKGFGKMWEKTYELRFSDPKKTPFEIATTTKENFIRFQPPQNNFYPSPAGIVAGETVLIRSSVGGIPILTGVLVSYADDVSFTFMTPQGHPESGWVTFRVFKEANETVCQIQGLARANDPIYEIAFRLHGSKFQEQTWMHVLGSLARHLDVNSQPTMKKRVIAPKMQWSQVGNIRHNAQLWTLAYLLIWPIRRVVRIFKK